MKLTRREMETQTLIDVLNRNRNKRQVDLPKVSNAGEFWKELTNYVFGCLPSGEIDGIPSLDIKIEDSMRKFSIDDSMDLLNKQGKILKRLGKYFKGLYGVEIPNRFMGVIGDRLQYYVNQETRPFFVDFTDKIDWEDGKFGKEDSCWWGMYSASRESYIDGGGWGLRFYESMDDQQGIGRLWVMPKYGVLLCFNAYGVDRAKCSKVIKNIFDQEGIELHYSRVNLYNSHNENIPYINGDSNPGSSGAFVLYADQHEERYDIDCPVIDDREICTNCSRRIDEDEQHIRNNEIYCEGCADRLFIYCDRCNEYCDASEVHEVRDSRRYSQICESCADGFGLCDDCGYYSEDYVITNESNIYCDHCRDYHCFYCEHCGEDIENEHQNEHNREQHNPCKECHEVFNCSDDLYSHNEENHPELIIELAVY